MAPMPNEPWLQKIYSTAVSSTVIPAGRPSALAPPWLLAITRRITSRSAFGRRGGQDRLAGDLSSTIDAQGRDEVADLLRALSEMNNNLAQIRQHGAQQLTPSPPALSRWPRATPT